MIANRPEIDKNLGMEITDPNSILPSPELARERKRFDRMRIRQIIVNSALAITAFAGGSVLIEKAYTATTNTERAEALVYGALVLTMGVGTGLEARDALTGTTLSLREQQQEIDKRSKSSFLAD